MDDLRNDVREIKTALIGNEKMGQRGLVHRVDRHGEYIEKDKKHKQKAFGIFLGLQLAWAGFITWLKFKF